MSKMTDYQADTRLKEGDIFIKDGTGGTKKITAKNAAIELAGQVSAINHRNIYRGNNLGGTVTAEQKNAISSGTFDNLFIGDYWNINSVNWVIADMDYFYNTGGTAGLAKHHLVIVPKTCIGTNQKMNDDNITTGGYYNSKMHTTNLSEAKTLITKAFSNLVLSHKEYLTNAVSSGHASAGSWYESTLELMNEIMVYGCPVFTPMNNGTTISTNYTLGKQQLALFALSPRDINIRADYWLRDVVSASNFADVSSGGYANFGGASISFGVRPYFIIG